MYTTDVIRVFSHWLHRLHLYVLNESFYIKWGL